MDFIDHLQTYFTAEKNLGYFLIPVGIALITFAVYLWISHKSPLGYGMLIPMLLIGILGIGIGIGLSYQSQQRLTVLPQSYQADQKAFIEQELPRMEKVMQNFTRLKMSWAIIIIIGLLFIFFIKKDWLSGISLSLILICAIFLIVDTLAERRAEIYIEQIKMIQQQE
jgi:drug/metabolite transporter (DMT)-like permease